MVPVVQLFGDSVAESLPRSVLYRAVCSREQWTSHRQAVYHWTITKGYFRYLKTQLSAETSLQQRKLTLLISVVIHPWYLLRLTKLENHMSLSSYSSLPPRMHHQFLKLLIIIKHSFLTIHSIIRVTYSFHHLFLSRATYSSIARD